VRRRAGGISPVHRCRPGAHLHLPAGAGGAALGARGRGRGAGGAGGGPGAVAMSKGQPVVEPALGQAGSAPVPAERTGRWARALLVFPVGMLIVFFVVPLIMLVVVSFYRNIPGAGWEPAFTLENYV